MDFSYLGIPVELCEILDRWIAEGTLKFEGDHWYMASRDDVYAETPRTLYWVVAQAGANHMGELFRKEGR